MVRIWAWLEASEAAVIWVAAEAGWVVADGAAAAAAGQEAAVRRRQRNRLSPRRYPQAGHRSTR